MPISFVESLYCIHLCHCVCPSSYQFRPAVYTTLAFTTSFFRPGLVTAVPSLFVLTTSSLLVILSYLSLSFFSTVLLNDSREHRLILILSIAMAGAKRKLDTAHASAAPEGASQSANSNIPFPFLFFLFH